MGDLIALAERRADRARLAERRLDPGRLAESRADRRRLAAPSRPAFFFDLGCPFSYLAAERVERVLGDIAWIPTAGTSLRQGPEWSRPAVVRAQAERLAGALRIPLVWPDSFPAPVPAALRAATYAAETGKGSRFALAASRLAFCGGFDLEEPDSLAEAAAAAGIGLYDCLRAASDATRDGALEAMARGLLAHGIHRLPAIRVGRQWLAGDGALAGAAALLRERPVYAV